MKLIIQIPCFNEERTLPATYADLPQQIDGVDLIEVLIIDDGSTDDTVRVAREIGVDHIIRHGGNRGLAAAFSTGIRACLLRDADIIVNTDADNQYCGADIEKLVRPLLAAKASIVIGDRQTDSIDHFSWTKKMLQRIGTKVVRLLSGTELNDAVSGFRSFTREAALELNVVTSFSYTIETLIQAGAKKVPVTSVPIRTNRTTRKSRLFRSTRHFVTRQMTTLLRSYLMYHPARSFLGIGLFFGLSAAGILLTTQLFSHDNSINRWAGLIVFAVLLAAAVSSTLMSLLADLHRNCRRLTEMSLATLRQIECSEALSNPMTLNIPVEPSPQTPKSSETGIQEESVATEYRR